MRGTLTIIAGDSVISLFLCVLCDSLFSFAMPEDFFAKNGQKTGVKPLALSSGL